MHKFKNKAINYCSIFFLLRLRVISGIKKFAIAYQLRAILLGPKVLRKENMLTHERSQK